MARARVIDDRVADVEHLLGSACPDEIASRLGYSNVNSLRRIMHKAGRRDLVDALGPDTGHAWATRQGMRRRQLEATP